MRNFILKILRKLGVLYYTDKIRFYIHYILKWKDTQKFKKENPAIRLPPAYLIYESFHLNYYKYYFNGRDSAYWLINHLKKYKELIGLNILDWGCGPSRIVRHLPSLLGNSCSIYATDYNEKSISWNRNNIPSVNFNLNNLNPPLSYVDNSFDIIYGISIFTHLTEDLHYRWFNELVRVSKNNGIIFLTLSGEVFKVKLTKTEMEIFDSGKLVTKGKTKIGHRTYSAYHPVAFVEKLFGKHQVLTHIPGRIRGGKLEQDVWIIRVVKKESMVSRSAIFDERIV